MGVLGLLGSVFGFFSGLVKFFTTRQEQAVGAAAQAQKDTQVAVKTETAIAQAEVDAPKGQADIIVSMERGTF